MHLEDVGKDQEEIMHLLNSMHLINRIYDIICIENMCAPGKFGIHFLVYETMILDQSLD